MKMNNKDLEKIYGLIDHNAIATVGMICKRIEILQENKSLTPELYKSLTKELTYEASRNLKKLLEVYFSIGKVEFKSKPKNSSEKKL